MPAKHISNLIALPADEDALIDNCNIGDYTGIAPQTHCRWRCEGSGPPFVKLGRRIFYRAGDIREWIQDSRQSNNECNSETP